MSDASHPSLKDTAREIAAQFENCIANGTLDAVADEHLAVVLGAAIRLFAAKAQAGRVPPVGHENHTINATDAAILCTAVLEAAGIEVFELSAWQALTDVGSKRRSPAQIGRNQRI
jgi:hypothetical protein